MTWQVTVSGKVEKQIPRLPLNVRQRLFALMAEIEQSGPVRGNWPNYSKLSPGRHHCHVKKGKPCFVAVWEERYQAIKLVEVTYVGTHEKAPY